MFSGQQNRLGSSRATRRGQRVLQPAGELDSISRGNSSKHFLLQRSAEVHELRRHRVGHRPRDHARLRRSGQAVRFGR